MRKNKGSALFENPVIIGLVAVGCISTISLLGLSITASFDNTTKQISLFEDQSEGNFIVKNDSGGSSAAPVAPYDFGFGDNSRNYGHSQPSISIQKPQLSNSADKTDKINDIQPATATSKPQTDTQYAIITELKPGKDYFEGSGQSENFQLTDGSDTVYANDGEDVINAGGGADLVYGGKGNDTIYGAGGNDTIYADQGDDIVYAGTGNDIVHTGKGADQIFAGAGDDTVHGQNSNDIIFGEEGVDILYGDGGDDEIHGGPGDDTIYGGEGFDTIYGDAGNDIIYGGKGADSVIIGVGDDRVYTGPSDDTIICDSNGTNGFQHIISAGTGNDSILIQANAPNTFNNKYTIEPGNGKDVMEFYLYDLARIVVSKEITVIEDIAHNRIEIYGFNHKKDKLTVNEVEINESYIKNLEKQR